MRRRAPRLDPDRVQARLLFYLHGGMGASGGGCRGWQRGFQDGEEYWYFGVDGEARLTVAPEMDGFLMVVHDQERSDGPRQSWIIPRIESVGEWLDEHEAEHAGLTPLGEEFKQALERGEPDTSDT